MQGANPFKRTEAVQPKVKLLLFGAAGVGKTYFSLGAPGKVAVIDTEGGTAFYSGRAGLSEFDVLSTKTYRDVREAIQFIANGNHGYSTLVIDPVTVIWETLQDAAQIRRAALNAKRGRGSTNPDEADLEMLDWAQIKRAWKSTLTALINLPVHVICVAREKEDVEKRGEQLVKVGYKADAEKATGYFFDAILRLTSDGATRKAVVIKDRTGAHALGAEIAAPTFATVFGKVLDSKATGVRVTPDEETAAAVDALVDAGDLASKVVDALIASGIDPDAVLEKKGWENFDNLTDKDADAIIAWASKK